MYSHIPNRHTYTFIYFPKICSHIRHYSGLYVYYICSQSTLYDFYLVCLLPIHYFQSFYRPAACLEAHPAGVPGNCHLLASLSIRPPGTKKLLLTKCLRICDKVTKGYICGRYYEHSLSILSASNFTKWLRRSYASIMNITKCY